MNGKCISVYVLITCIFLCCMSSAAAFSSGRKSAALKPQTVTVEGFIRVYGNEPHTYIGLVLADGTAYTLEAEDRVLQDLRSKQGCLLAVTGVVEPAEDGKIPAAETLSAGILYVRKTEVLK